MCSSDLLSAQMPTWSKAGALEPRSGHVVAYDISRRVAVLFGGFQAARYDETWEWDGVTWTLRSPAVRPAARRDGSLAYDSLRQRMVLFGGNGVAGGLGDTWEWDGGTWMQVATSGSPSARDGAQMTFDATRGVTLLYGGQGVEIGRAHV